MISPPPLPRNFSQVLKTHIDFNQSIFDDSPSSDSPSSLDIKEYPIEQNAHFCKVKQWRVETDLSGFNNSYVSEKKTLERLSQCRDLIFWHYDQAPTAILKTLKEWDRFKQRFCHHRLASHHLVGESKRAHEYNKCIDLTHCLLATMTSLYRFAVNDEKVRASNRHFHSALLLKSAHLSTSLKQGLITVDSELWKNNQKLLHFSEMIHKSDQMRKQELWDFSKAISRYSLDVSQAYEIKLAAIEKAIFFAVSTVLNGPLNTRSQVFFDNSKKCDELHPLSNQDRDINIEDILNSDPIF